MSYVAWTGSTDPEDKTGEAFIIVEGESLSLRLPDFTTAFQLDRLLTLAFQQGKQFAARAMRSHVERALDDAVSQHDLRVTAGVLASDGKTITPAAASEGDDHD